MKNEQIRLQLKKRLESLFAGEFRSRERETRGYDFQELKPMKFGDDPRSLDLRSHVLRDEFYLRIREPERSANIYLLIDSSRSVSFGSGYATKWEVILEIASLLAKATLSGVNRVALVFFGETVEKFYALQSDGEIINAALKAAQGSKPIQKKSDLKNALHFTVELSESYKTRPSAIFIISDFLFDVGYEAILTDISKKLDVLAFVVFDPRERSWKKPNFSVVTFEDLESGKLSFAKEEADIYSDLPSIFKKCGIDYAFFGTNETAKERVKRLIEFFDELRT